MQFKLLITSGCSFSDASTGITWPLHLEKTLDVSSHHLGLCSQGNGLIARKVIHAVHDALKSGYNRDEILVGIMWSGAERYDTFFQTNPLTETDKNNDGWLTNPSQFVNGADGGWVIMNPWWKETINKAFYNYLYDEVGAVINTYEKILWTQNYLKNLGIRYFMTSYHPNTFFNHRQDRDPNVSWLQEQIDKSFWLPVDNMHSWTTLYWDDNHFQKFLFIDKDRDIEHIEIDFHPSRKMHIKFVDTVILPYLTEKYSNYTIPAFVEYPSPPGYEDPYGKEIITRVFSST